MASHQYTMNNGFGRKKNIGKTDEKLGQRKMAVVAAAIAPAKNMKYQMFQS